MLNIELDDNADAQTNFDIMYPEREITVTSSDPPYITLTVKALLQRKNRLMMHAGRTDEAGPGPLPLEFGPSSRAAA